MIKLWYGFPTTEDRHTSQAVILLKTIQRRLKRRSHGLEEYVVIKMPSADRKKATLRKGKLPFL